MQSNAMHRPNASRARQPSSACSIEDDYLACRGYPMSEANRRLVRATLARSPEVRDRRSAFRYLDEQLLRSRHPAVSD